MTCQQHNTTQHTTKPQRNKQYTTKRNATTEHSATTHNITKENATQHNDDKKYQQSTTQRNATQGNQHKTTQPVKRQNNASNTIPNTRQEQHKARRNNATQLNGELYLQRFLTKFFRGVFGRSTSSTVYFISGVLSCCAGCVALCCD